MRRKKTSRGGAADAEGAELLFEIVPPSSYFFSINEGKKRHESKRAIIKSSATLRALAFLREVFL
jgi:hypothetical protein